MSEVKPDKGKRGGACNMSRCQAQGAWFYNRGSFAWYCRNCADLLNQANPELFADGKPMVIPVPENATDSEVAVLTRFVSWKGGRA